MTDASVTCPGCFLEPRSGAACPRCAYRHDPDAFPSALQPGAVLSKYTLGRVLGRPGGFGITYLAFDPVLHRRVAIKELMPRELVARRADGATVNVHTRHDSETFKNTLASFLNEARLLAQFSHPHVVRVLDYFEANGTAYFAMEYYEGQTLAEYVDHAGGRLPGPEAVGLMLPLLAALGDIHSAREPILHRDIKPANIYLTDKQTPILLDFGAARVAMGEQTRSLSAVLTPGFAPYEQYSTLGKQGPWSDVYACAATLYVLVTGRMLPAANERVDDPRIEPPRAYAPDLPAHLSDAIVYGLGFRPEERPQTATAFADLISGRQPVPLPAERAGAVPGNAPIGVSGLVTMGGMSGATGFAPHSAALGAKAVSPADHAAPAWETPARRPSNRTPILVVAAALLLVVTAGWALTRTGDERTPNEASDEPIVTLDTPREAMTPPEPAPRTSTTETPVEQPEPAEQPGPKPAPAPTADEPQPPVPVPPPPPVTAPGVLVVIRGDDADGARQAESAILRSLVGRNGLQALDATSLSMLKGDQSAVQAATEGDFAELATMGKQHGVELMVVGELRARAVRSLGQFYTGTAELTVKMYRVSNSRIVDTQTFTVGPGGLQPVLAPSDGDARTRAATQAANAAADGVGSWLSRAF